ncbi:MAG: hypothetical protein GX371_11260 [Bacteroidales bacterium]|nr:hypothetical protein [Bacteroidales bacterium]
MKKIILLLSVLFSGITFAAQPLSGTYKNGSDSLKFEGNQIVFRVSGFGGLSSSQAGAGTYELINDFLLVHTGDYPGNKSTFQELPGSRADTCVVKVVGLSNYPVEGILVEPDNSSTKLPAGRVTGNDGKIYLANTSKMKNITVSGMGYNTITIDYDTGIDYLVKLADDEIIENKTVVFRLKEVDDETLSILLLTDDFNAGKKRDNELNKLERAARRSNRIDKRFKKEYEPYVRRVSTR